MSFNLGVSTLQLVKRTENGKRGMKRDDIADSFATQPSWP